MSQKTELTDENAAADLAEFVRQAIAHRDQDDTAYTSVRDHLSDAVASSDSDALCKWLESFCLCISSLDRNCDDLVDLALDINWYTASDHLLEEIREFVLSLVSAHSLYAYKCTKRIITRIAQGSDQDLQTDPDEVVDVAALEECVNRKLCKLLHEVLEIVPSHMEKLEQTLESKAPHHRLPTVNVERYTRALLMFAQRDPNKLLEMIVPIVVKIILQVDIDTTDYGDDDVDAMSSADELDTQFDFDEDRNSQHDDVTDHDGDNIDTNIDVEMELQVMDEDEDEEEEPPSHKLDVLMQLMFEFMTLDSVMQKAKLLFNVLWNTFEKQILPTYKTKHVQYLLFFACSLGGTSHLFVEKLLAKAIDKSVPLLLRQTAISYVSSFVARALFAPLIVTQLALSKLTDWLHDYVRRQHEPQYQLGSMAKHHIAFYAKCQAVFYIVCFRLDDLLDDEKIGAAFVATLRLDLIVKSALCPLLVCQPFVVKEFSRLTKLHQIVFCAQYMRRRSVVSIPMNFTKNAMSSRDGEPPSQELENFFPFDPYLLQASHPQIEGLYREWLQRKAEGNEDYSDSENSAVENDDDDDFLGSSANSDTSAALMKKDIARDIAPRNSGVACDIILNASRVIRARHVKRLRVNSNSRKVTSPNDLDIPGFGSPSTFSPYSLEHKPRSNLNNPSSSKPQPVPTGLDYLDEAKPFKAPTSR